MEAAQGQGRGTEVKRMRATHWLVVLLGTLASAGVVGCTQPQETLTIDPAKTYLDAKAALLQEADAKEADTRSHTIEALAQTLGEEAGAVYTQGLDDESPVVRFAAALAIGDVKYAPALPRLLKMPLLGKGERDKRVFCAAIYALYRLGNDDHAGELGKLLFDETAEVRAAAAMAMGKMGEPSAMGPLRSILSNEQDIRTQIQLTESLALLGDSKNAEVIEAFTKGYYLDLRLAAIPAMGRCGSPRAERVLKELLEPRNPARVRVAAAGELAKMGVFDQGGYDLCLSAAQDPQGVLDETAKGNRRAADDDAASLQQLAAIALGWMGRETIANTLTPLLGSRKGPVRVAAAMSLLRLLKNYRPISRAPEPPATQPAGSAAQPDKPDPKPKLYSAGGKD